MSLQKVAPEKLQKKIFQELQELEEQKTKEALELWGRKHNLGKLEMKGIQQGWYRGWSCQGPKVFFGAFDSSSLDSCPPSLAQDAGDAMSSASWTFLAKWKERDWWSVDLEGEMEKLEVEGGLSGDRSGTGPDRRRIRGS